MENKEKGIYIAVIIVLLVIIIAGGVYIINNKPNDDVQKNNPNEETITMSDKELKELLSYVPNTHIQSEEKTIAYSKKKSDTKTINESTLIGMALRKLNGEPDKEYSKSEVENTMKKLYNIENIDLENSGNNWVAGDGSMCYAYNDGFFSGDYCAPGSAHFSSIEDYKATENEVIIYEIVARPFDDPSPILYDYYTKKEVNTNINMDNSNKYTEEMEKYFINHKNEFTKYKSTFKKNDLGYYWYSTEVVD